MTLATAPAARPVPMLKGKPFIGNAGEFGKDSLGMMDHVWKERGDIFGLRLGPRTFYIVSHPDLAHEALVDRKSVPRRPADFNGGTLLTPLLGLSVLTTDGETWFAKRRMMQPIFHRPRIQGMGETMTAAAGQMLER